MQTQLGQRVGAIFNRARPTIYLDHSHLVDAFHGAHGDRRGRATATFVTDASQVANICLQMPHLLELAGWKDESAADSMAVWLGGMQVVWSDFTDFVHKIEPGEALIAIANPLDLTRYVPFVGSLADVYGRFDAGAANFLRRASLPTILKALRDHEIDAEPFAEVAVQTASRFTQDRARARRFGPGQARVDRVLDCRARTYVARELGRAHAQLVATNDHRYRCYGPQGTRHHPDKMLFQRLAATVLATPALMPARFTREKVWRAFSWRLSPDANPSSAKFTKRHRGTLVDWFHAEVGAAYADIFTCDQATSRDLAGVRERLCLMPAVAGESSLLVEQLSRQLERLVAAPQPVRRF